MILPHFAHTAFSEARTLSKSTFFREGTRGFSHKKKAQREGPRWANGVLCSLNLLEGGKSILSEANHEQYFTYSKVLSPSASPIKTLPSSVFFQHFVIPQFFGSVQNDHPCMFSGVHIFSSGSAPKIFADIEPPVFANLPAE